MVVKYNMKKEEENKEQAECESLIRVKKIRPPTKYP